MQHFKICVSIMVMYVLSVFGSLWVMSKPAYSTSNEPSKVNVILWVDVPKTMVLTSMSVDSIDECRKLIYIIAVKENNDIYTMSHSYCYDVNNPSILYGYKATAAWPDIKEFSFGQVKTIEIPG